MALAAQAEAKLGRGLLRLCNSLAVAGGLIMCGVALVTMVSIIGRAMIGFGLSPVKGDYEIAATGTAIAIFFFLPLCQIKRGHVTVDVFITRLPKRMIAILGFLGDVVIAVCAYVILWRFWLGFGEKYPFGSDAFRSFFSMGSKPFFPETSYELELPVWIPMSVGMVGAIVFAVVSFYCVWRSLNWVLDGQEGEV